MKPRLAHRRAEWHDARVSPIPVAEPGRPWGWAVAAGALALALIVDLWDGAPLKAATSALVFVACLILAVSKVPRAKGATYAAGGLVLSAAALIVYRLLGPGL